MSWKRNGKTQGANAAHPAEYCGYQYHAAFNPDHDYDFINYSDTLEEVHLLPGADDSARKDK
jgi:hypothetical protein